MPCQGKRRIRFIWILLMGVMICSTAPKAVDGSSSPPFIKGETLHYTVEKFMVKVGEASLVYGGIVEVQGRQAHLITVTGSGFQFYDQDKIYLDAGTFRPILVERNLDIFGNKEKITEYYSADNGKVRIVKNSGGKMTEQVIESDEPFDHIYGFIYGQRRRGEIREGEEFTLNLPTREVKFAKSVEKKIRLNGKDYSTLYMQSKPRKYKVYFGKNTMIPLRIHGAIGIGNMSMIYVDPDD